MPWYRNLRESDHGYSPVTYLMLAGPRCEDNLPVMATLTAQGGIARERVSAGQPTERVAWVPPAAWAAFAAWRPCEGRLAPSGARQGRCFPKNLQAARGSDPPTPRRCCAPHPRLGRGPRTRTTSRRCRARRVQSRRRRAAPTRHRDTMTPHDTVIRRRRSSPTAAMLRMDVAGARRRDALAHTSIAARATLPPRCARISRPRSPRGHVHKSAESSGVTGNSGGLNGRAPRSPRSSAALDRLE